MIQNKTESENRKLNAFTEKLSFVAITAFARLVPNFFMR